MSLVGSRSQGSAEMGLDGRGGGAEEARPRVNMLAFGGWDLSGRGLRESLPFLPPAV